MHLPYWIWMLIYALTSRNAADWVDAQFYSITSWVGWLYGTAYDAVIWVLTTAKTWINYVIQTVKSWIDWLASTAYKWVVWLIETGYEWIKWLIDQADKLWTYIKETVWKAVEALIDWSNKFIDAVSAWFKSIWDYAVGLYNSVVTWIDDLWGGLKALWNQFVDWVGESLKQVYTYIEDLYDQIMGQVLKWLDNLEAALRASIQGVSEYFDSWIKNILIWAERKFNELTANVEHLFLFLGDAFEDSFTLTVNAVVGTVSKHGLRLLRELWDFILPEPTAEDTARLNQIHLASEIDKHVSMMDLPKGSEWEDIGVNIDMALEAMDRGEDPPDLDLNDALLPPDERVERDQAGQWLDDWYGRRL